MNKTKFDLLIINGDSFSDGGGVYEQFAYENGYELPTTLKPGWALFLSELLNVPICNLARGGQSNKSMINSTIRFLENDSYFYHFNNSNNQQIDLADYKNILFITQWSFLHRFNVFYDNMFIDIMPNGYDEKLKYYISDESTHSQYKSYVDLRYGCIDNKETVEMDFITNYFLYNSYLKTKSNITHLNWGFVPFLQHKEYYIDAKNKLKEFPFNFIDDDIDMNDLKSVAEVTNGKVNDSHYCWDSNKKMAQRVFDYLQKTF